MKIDQIKNFRQLNSITAGHPEYGHAKGIETTTGPLGQGLANAVGMAISQKLFNKRFGSLPFLTVFCQLSCISLILFSSKG